MRRFRVSPSSALIPALLMASAGSWAQTPPDAGALRQQIDRDHPPALPEKKAGVDGQAQVPKAKPGGVTVTVKAFSFSGNSLLSDAQLQAVVAPYVGKTLDLSGLQAAAAAVSEAYRQAGRVVRAVLPRQAIENGLVKIDVVEALLGRIVGGGKTPRRVPLPYIMSVVQGRQTTGQAVDLAALDRGVMLADDLPGVVVAGFLRQGESANSTDVVLKLDDEPVAMGDLTLDNSGNRSTGSARVAADMFFTSPLNFGDLASATTIASKGSTYLRARTRCRSAAWDCAWA